MINRGSEHSSQSIVNRSSSNTSSISSLPSVMVSTQLPPVITATGIPSSQPLSSGAQIPPISTSSLPLNPSNRMHLHTSGRPIVPPLSANSFTATTAATPSLSSSGNINIKASNTSMYNQTNDVGIQRELKVEDALCYLDQVKHVFSDNQGIYNQFLDIMKNFKSHMIDTPGVIERVSTLFKGHPKLITGFNTFLPQGFKIGEDLTYTVPGDHQPHRVDSVSPIYTNESKPIPNDQQVYDNTKAFMSKTSEIIHSSNSKSIIPPSIENTQATVDLQSRPSFSNERPVKPNVGAVNTGTNAQPVEFDHAITYVTRIKKRFSDEPDTYKAFLEILHTYQKEQRSIKQVLDQVSHLFRDHEDLLQEFTYFLPDNAQEQAKDRLNRAAEKAVERKRAKRQKAQEKKDEKMRLMRESEKYRTLKNEVLERREKDRERQKLRYQEKKAKKRSYDDKERRDRFALEENAILPSEWNFFDRAKKVLPSRESWREFMKCLDLYSQEVIDKEEMMALIQNLFGRHQDIIRDFETMLNQHGGHDSQSDIWFSMPLAEIDFSRCRRCTPSYRALPSTYPNPLCSVRSELEKSVCNDAWVSVPTGSEDFSFKSMRKNQYEEALFKCEDERFEIDMIIDANACTIRILEPLVREIKCLREKENSPDFRWQYRLDRRTLGAIHLNAISRVYGDSGLEILEVLRKHPAGALPVILDRLKQKDAEWRRARQDLNKQWKEVNEKNFHKSLDHCSFYFKQQDKKKISAKGLVNEAKEKLKVSEEKNQPPSDDVVSTTSNIDELDDNWNYHFSYEFSDPSIHKHAFAILQFAAEQSCSGADKERIIKLWKDYLLIFFNLPEDWLVIKPQWVVAPSTLADALVSGTEVLTPYGPGTVESFRETDSCYFIDLPFGQGFFQANKLKVKDNDKFPPNICASDDLKYCQQEKKNFLSSEHVKILYDGQAAYLFFRLYQILYHRLFEARNLCEKAKRYRCRITYNPAARALAHNHHDEKEGKEKAGDYDAFIAHLYGLIEGTIDNVKFEDICRNLMGSSSFLLFTMDKLISQLLKQLQNLGTDEPTEFLKLFKIVNNSSDRVLPSQYFAKCKSYFEGEDAYRIQFNCGVLRQTPIESPVSPPIDDQVSGKIWAPSPRYRQTPSPWLVKPTLYVEYLGPVDNIDDADNSDNEPKEVIAEKSSNESIEETNDSTIRKEDQIDINKEQHRDNKSPSNLIDENNKIGKKRRRNSVDNDDEHIQSRSRTENSAERESSEVKSIKA